MSINEVSSNSTAAGERRNASLSLRRALNILTAVADAAREGRTRVTVSELAEHLGINKSTVTRLATPMVEMDMLRRSGDGSGYQLGMEVLLLGQSYLESIDMRSVAAPFLRSIVQETSHTCHLVVPDGHSVVYIDKVENHATVRMASRVGNRMPMHTTAVGKAIIAFSDAELLEEIVEEGIAPATAFGLSDEASFRREIARSYSRGYAIDDRENEPEVRCVAAPIFDHANLVIGALSISSLVSRMPPAEVRRLGVVVMKTGLQISVALGSSSAKLRLQNLPTTPA